MNIHTLACKPARTPACRQAGIQAKPANRPLRQQADLNINRGRHGIKRGSVLGFQPQDEQQMYNNEKMFDFLYFSEE
ncbi:hypothetical protein [Bacteroides sp. An51A]|uniref:hypothetical protein n=1 Tax=Bacteroides sp. An51A TaxID=1965640 RepID=UPI001302976E|nr:hypothetical protein [Bacteroides sp. An51A]